MGGGAAAVDGGSLALQLRNSAIHSSIQLKTRTRLPEAPSYLAITKGKPKPSHAKLPEEHTQAANPAPAASKQPPGSTCLWELHGFRWAHYYPLYATCVLWGGFPSIHRLLFRQLQGEIVTSQRSFQVSPEILSTHYQPLQPEYSGDPIILARFSTLLKQALENITAYSSWKYWEGTSTLKTTN